MGSLSLILVIGILVSVNGDMYLHNPRGSNNRLNENTATRTNANRAFDSQNNNRGGYNVGDRTKDKAGNNAANQYQMEYFMSGPSKNDPSKFIIEWTNQHGCGGNEDDNPHKLNCDIIIQYMDVDPKDPSYDARSEGGMRDGTNTNTQNYNANAQEQNKDGKRTFAENAGQFINRKAGSVDPNRVLQEPFEWYDKCQKRPRNKGLFTADQNVNQDRATHTRQNPGGTRRGYECPEERDHYPYWHPTPFKDIAILTKHTDRCDIYEKESFNSKPKGECVEKFSNGQHRPYSGAETKAKCDELDGTWVEFYNYLQITDLNKNECEGASSKKASGFKYKWAVPYLSGAINRLEEKCLVLLSAPDCKQAPWSRHNHLGNGADLEPLRYEWTMPHFPHFKEDEKRAFVLRIRYNISTDDYDPFNTDANLNGDDKSPVTNNPLVDAGTGHSLRLAINTAQFGRTFQDRSHKSYFIQRPKDVKGIIHNLSVRGKRGNIVQTFPAVEYDYMPSILKIKQADHVHMQWTGSNSHNNGGNGGDGQTGDAGQGTGGTDRTNIVCLKAIDDNFPQPMEQEDCLCHNIDVVWERSKGVANPKWYDICLKLGSGGYYDCKAGCANALDTKAQMNNLLNNTPASFSGMLVRFKNKAVHYYTCTRNNNFTNRSQKGQIHIE